MQNNSTPHVQGLQAVGPQLVGTKGPKRHAASRNPRSFSPQMRALVMEDCRIHGCAYTAKQWGVTFGFCLELQVERLANVIEQQKQRIAWLERKAA